MPSKAVSAYGTLLKIGDGADPEVFTTVGEVQSISGPSFEIQEVDVTTHGSAAAGSYMESRPTLIDPGSVEFDINYVPDDATHIAIRTAALAKTVKNWKLELPGAVQTISFSGYIKSMPLEFPIDDVIKQKISVRLTGAVTFA